MIIADNIIVASLIAGNVKSGSAAGIANKSNLLELTATYIAKENKATEAELIEIVGDIFTQLDDYNSFLRYKKAVVKEYGNADVINRMLNLAEMKIRPFCWQIVEDIHESFYQAVTGQINSLPLDVQRELSALRGYNFNPNTEMPVLFVSFRRGLELKVEWVNSKQVYTNNWTSEFTSFDPEKLMITMSRTTNYHLAYGQELDFNTMLTSTRQENTARTQLAKTEDGYGVFIIPIILEQPDPSIAGVADLIMRIPPSKIPAGESQVENKEAQEILGKIYYLFPPFMRAEIKQRYALQSSQIDPLTALSSDIPTEEELWEQFNRVLINNKDILQRPTLPDYPLRPLTSNTAGRFKTDKFIKDFSKLGQLEETLQALPPNSADFEIILDLAIKVYEGDVLSALAASRDLIRRSPNNFAETLEQIGGEQALAIASDLKKRGIELEFTEKTAIEQNLKDIPSLPSRLKRVTYDHALSFIIIGFYAQCFIESGDAETAKDDLVNMLNDEMERGCNQANADDIASCREQGRRAWLENLGMITFDSETQTYLFNDSYSPAGGAMSMLLGGVEGMDNASPLDLLALYKLFKKSYPDIFSGLITLQQRTNRWIMPEYEAVSWHGFLSEELDKHGQDIRIEQYAIEAHACSISSKLYFAVESLTSQKE
ncbi:MAG: hypothetical protein ABID35_05860 [Candidatus Margulisiibacteriota bacterium]